MTTLRRDMTFLMAVLVAGIVFFSGCGKQDKKGHKKTASLETTQVQEQVDNPKFADAGAVLEGEQIDESLFDDQGQELVQANEDELGDDFENDDDFEMPELDEKQLPAVHFGFNESNVLPEEKVLLNQDIEAVRPAIEEGRKVLLTGHCDQLGSPSHNMALSVARANTIKDEMVKQGIAEDAIEVVGAGSEMPLVQTDAQERDQKIVDLAPNRRVEISVI